jgi:hypothetical protein
MKKSILVSAAALLISAASFAQSDLVRKNPQDTVIVEGNQNKHTDGVMMTEGTMKLVRNEVISTMVAEITMNNGTVVSVDGTYVKADQNEI